VWISVSPRKSFHVCPLAVPQKVNVTSAPDFPNATKVPLMVRIGNVPSGFIVRRIIQLPEVS
jgi:hypothetical protein